MRKGNIPCENQDGSESSVYACSNLCKYPYYSVDFGWGRPERVCLANGPFKNEFFLKRSQNWARRGGTGDVADATNV